MCVCVCGLICFCFWKYFRVAINPRINPKLNLTIETGLVANLQGQGPGPWPRPPAWWD